MTIRVHVATACLALLGLLLTTAPASAQEKDYALSNYDVTLTVRPDGTYEVEETIRLDVQRGTFRTMYREVDGDLLDSLSTIRVSSPDAGVDSVRVDRDGDDVEVRWAYPPRTTPATFVLTYRAYGGVVVRGGENVVKWMAVGTGWDVPVRDVDVTVRLPAEWDVPRDSLRLDPEAVATDRAGGRGWAVTFQRDALKAGQGYSVELVFPKRIEGRRRASGMEVMMGFLLFVLTMGGFIVARYRMQETDPQVRPPERPPVKDLAEAARILSDSRSGRMHDAMLFDFANRGALTLRAETEDGWFETETTVHLDVGDDRSGLSAFERDYLDALAACDTLDDVAQATKTVRKHQRTDIRKRLVDRGWLRDRGEERRKYVLLCVASGIGLIGVGMGSIWAGLVEGIYAVGLLGGITLGGLLLVEPQFPRTETGRRKRAEMRAYLERVRTEMERLRDADPETAARRLPEVLPWLLLDKHVTSSWMKTTGAKLEDAGVTDVVPTWLRSTGDEGVDVTHLTTLIIATNAGGASSAGSVAGAGGAGAAGGGGGGAG